MTFTKVVYLYPCAFFGSLDGGFDVYCFMIAIADFRKDNDFERSVGELFVVI